MPDCQKVFSLLEKDRQATMLEQLAKYSIFQRLIATLLSSRTKDTTTLPLVKRLFQKYGTPQDFIQVKASTLEKELYGIGFYKVKARNIQKLSKILRDKYAGAVPKTFAELTSLPGVGRKTANCLLNYAFGQPTIAVDTHVHRLSNRLGWIRTKKPEETEEALKRILPKKLWGKVNPLLVDHGQRVCLPLKPKCQNCPIEKYCQKRNH